MTKVKCDKCPAGFIVEDNMFTRPLEHDVEEVGFRCPECGDETIAYKIDDEIKTLQAKVERERRRTEKKIQAGMETKDAERKLRKAQGLLKHSLDRLNGRDGGE